MKNYPDVTMVKCPIRGIVFYADGLGERAFRTAQAAQEAINSFRAQRELTEKELAMSCPNRVVVGRTGAGADNPLYVEVFTDNEPNKYVLCADKRHARQVVGTLPEWETHNFIWND